ncbi:MAG: ribonuclease III [Slackia sp.]|nr:ribonuclease III [Slackia sp.]
MSHTPEQSAKLDLAQHVIGVAFDDIDILLAAITHPSATEGKPVKFSYERLEFLGDSILGAIVANEAFHAYPEIDEGGLTRIKVALVSGSSLSDVAAKLGFADIIVFGSSERGTGRRGLHSALENVYEAVVAALFLDKGMDGARDFVRRTLIPRMDIEMAREPENPKSALQEKLQEEGITPTYKLVETQGPPHDRTFVSQVFAGLTALAQGIGRTKKESESQAAKAALDMIDADGAQAPDARAMKELQKAEAKRAQAKAKEEQRRAKEEAKRQRAEARKGKDASFFGWPLKPAEPRELPAAADDGASPADKEL